MDFPTDQTIAPDALAVRAEELGFRWLLFPEHTHIPTSRRTPPPSGGDLPEHYRRTLDPFVASQAALQATSRLRAGPGVCLVAQRDPILTAKAAASVDHLSGGRFVFGIGYGWNCEEMGNHGVEYAQRRDVVAQKVRAIRRLWTEEAAEANDPHVSFEASWSWPKPVQPGGPPVVLGAAAGPRTLGHLVEFCDGWMPIPGRGMPFHEAMGDLRGRLEAAGRDPVAFEVTLYFAPDDPAVLADLASQGATRALHGLPSAPAKDVLARLDELAARHLTD